MFSIGKFLKPGDIMSVIAGNKDPFELLNGPMADKANEGLTAYLRSVKLTPEETFATIMITENNGSIVFSIVSMIDNGVLMCVSRLIEEVPIKNLGEFVKRAVDRSNTPAEQPKQVEASTPAEVQPVKKSIEISEEVKSTDKMPSPFKNDPLPDATSEAHVTYTGLSN